MHAWTRLGGATLALMIGMGGWGMALPARAADEDCLQCKHVDCIKGLIAQKTSLAAGYDRLATKWDRLVVPNVPGQDLRDFNAVQPQYRGEALRSMLESHRAFDGEENTMAAGVGAPAGCGFTVEDASTSTYPVCKIDAAVLQRAVDDAPCKQIGAMLKAHEQAHKTQCDARVADPGHGTFWIYRVEGANGNTAQQQMPPLMQTPAGRAREEARLHRKDITALEALRPKAEAKCKTSFSGVKTSCTIPSPAGSVSMGQEITGKACGNPVVANWTINVVNWVRAPYIGEQRTIDAPFDNDCVAKGSAEERRREAIYRAGPGKGWMCVYEDKPTPQIHIRYFRLPQCSAPTEQSYTVPAIRGECDEDEPPSPQRPTPPDRPNS